MVFAVIVTAIIYILPSFKPTLWPHKQINLGLDLQVVEDDVARAWLKHLPFGSVFTAERAAYSILAARGAEVIFVPRATQKPFRQRAMVAASPVCACVGGSRN